MKKMKINRIKVFVFVVKDPFNFRFEKTNKLKLSKPEVNTLKDTRLQNKRHHTSDTFKSKRHSK